MSQNTPDRRIGSRKPRVAIVGGVDVDQRIDLMREVADEFELMAAGSNPVLAKAFDEAGFPYHHYLLNRGMNPFADLRSLIHLRRLLRELEPDIVHTFATKPSVWGRLAAFSVGVPIVIGTLPGLGSLYATHTPKALFARSIAAWLQSLASSCSDVTIMQNRRDAVEVAERGIVPPDRIEIIASSGIRTEAFSPQAVPAGARERIRSELGAADGTVVVTMVSRVIRSKGVLEFAEAARLKDAHSKSLFVLVGGTDPDSFDRLSAGELDTLSGSLKWLGRRDDVPEILAGSDVFVFPSFYREGVPRVLLEAASMGLPLVSTQVPGCTDVVIDGMNGYLVPPNNPRALSEAVTRLAADRPLREKFGRASRELAVERFDLSVVARRTAAIYQRLLDLKRVR
jgi:glycosyltransferase involved in cell wall biosynthesis